MKRIPDKQGVVYEMAKRDIPIINLINIRNLLKEYELPRDPVPLPPVGVGTLFEAYQYDLSLVLITLIGLLSLLVAIIYLDNKQHKLGTLIISENDKAI